jgi:hypothetical protein
MNSSNTGLIFCGEQIGVTLADNVDRAMDATVFAVDFYQSGQVRDEIDDLTIVVGGERFSGSVSDIAAGATATMTITDAGADGTNPTESGILAILDAARSGFRGSPLGNDSLLLTVANPDLIRFESIAKGPPAPPAGPLIEALPIERASAGSIILRPGHRQVSTFGSASAMTRRPGPLCQATLQLHNVR